MAEAVSKAVPTDLWEVNDLAAEIARDSAAALVGDLTTTQRGVVCRVIARGLAEGWSDAVLRRRIAEKVGLDARYANAVDNYRATLAAQGVPKGRAERQVAAYAKRLRAYRALVIARTETQRALHEAQRAIWAQRQADGDVSPHAVRVWRTHKDERMCPICRPMNGQRASLKPNATYNVGRGIGRLAGPPAHPNCRCYEDLVDEGIVKTGISKHLRGLHDQDSHGRRRIFHSLIERVADRRVNAHSRVERGFAAGVGDVLTKYPHLQAHIARYYLDDQFTAVAAVQYKSGGAQVVLNPAKLRRAVVNLQDRIDRTGYSPWGVPEVQGNDAGRIDVHDYAYAVAVHEMGHIAHLHLNAVALGPGKVSGPTAVDNMRPALGIEDLPALTPYARSNGAERFAEWFAAHQFALLGPEHQIPAQFVQRFHDAMDREITWHRNGKHLIVKTEDVEDTMEHADFIGSAVEAYAVRQAQARIDKGITSRGRLDRSPKSNWVEDNGGLPRYIEDIAHALHTRRGMTISRAIAVAVSRVKLWAAGGGNVDADTRAKAAKAVAQWEALRAKAHAKDAAK